LEVPPLRKEAEIGFATIERDDECLAARRMLEAGNGMCTRHSDAIAY
jgi:hypothetical protein